MDRGPEVIGHDEPAIVIERAGEWPTPHERRPPVRSSAVLCVVLAVGASCATQRTRRPAPAASVAAEPSEDEASDEPERAPPPAPASPVTEPPSVAEAPPLSILPSPAPRLVAGENDDYCVRDTDVSPPRWRCLDGTSALEGDTDIVDIDGRGLSCRLDHTATVTCTSHTLPAAAVFAEVDAFAMSTWDDRLCVLRDGEVACGAPQTRGLSLSPIAALEDSVRIDLSEHEVCGLSELGRLRCVDAHEPTNVTLELEEVESYAAGETHACVIRHRHVQCWGSATHGELGDGSVLPTNWFDEREQTQPVFADGPTDPQALALGAEFSCALDRDGRVWCWGADSWGQLGRGVMVGASSEAEPVWDLTDVVELRAWNDRVCARLDDGGLRCWGKIGDRWPAAPRDHTAVAIDPRSPPRARYPLLDTCATRDLAQWSDDLKDASDTMRMVELLAALGMDPTTSAVALPNALPLHLDSVEIHEVQLDGTGPTERVVEVVVTAVDHERRMVAFLRAGDPAVAEQWCPIPDSTMASSTILDMRPCLEHDHEPEFAGGIDVSFVELTAAGKHAVEVRSQDGACGGYPRSSTYTTSYWELQGDSLVRIFGPFTTFDETHSVVGEPPWTYGTIRLTGGFPRRIVTKTTEDWSVDDYEDEDARPPRLVKKSRTWRYRKRRYR